MRKDNVATVLWSKQYKYHYHCRGFFRVNLCGWRVRLYDSRFAYIPYSSRTHGWRIGPLVIHVDWAGL